MKLNGHDIAEKMYQDLHNRVGGLQKKNLPAGRQGITPHLVVFLVGENPASVSYVNLKKKRGEEIGAKVTVLEFAETITTEELVNKVELLNNDPFVHGILIQRPLPAHIDEKRLELLTNPAKDIDGFHPNSPYTLPLPLAVVKILEEVYRACHSERNEVKSKNLIPQKLNSRVRSFDSPPAGGSLRMTTKETSFLDWLKFQNIVLLGKGPTGGGPILAHLKTLGITPTIIDSKTANPKQIMKQADIIIAATGREKMVKAAMIKQGVILIGVGVLRGADGKLTGDYNEEEIKDIAAYYTPTPKGVGPVNVAMLMENLVTATERQTQ